MPAAADDDTDFGITKLDKIKNLRTEVPVRCLASRPCASHAVPTEDVYFALMEQFARAM